MNKKHYISKSPPRGRILRICIWLYMQPLIRVRWIFEFIGGGWVGVRGVFLVILQCEFWRNESIWIPDPLYTIHIYSYIVIFYRSAHAYSHTSLARWSYCQHNDISMSWNYQVLPKWQWTLQKKCSCWNLHLNCHSELK